MYVYTIQGTKPLPLTGLLGLETSLEIYHIGENDDIDNVLDHHSDSTTRPNVFMMLCSTNCIRATLQKVNINNNTKINSI